MCNEPKLMEDFWTICMRVYGILYIGFLNENIGYVLSVNQFLK